MPTHYFAVDGSFGDATGLIVADTSALDTEDWSIIFEVPDSERLEVVRQILAESTISPDQLTLF